MATQTQTNTPDRRHINHINLPEGFTEEILVEWYKSYQPIGSGPLGTMRHMCALIETLAELKGIQLPPAKGLPKGRTRKNVKPFMSELEKAVRQAVGEQTGMHPDDIHMTKPFYEQGLDSLDMVEIVMYLEDEFEVEISDSIAPNMYTLEKCIEFIGNNSKKFKK